MSVRDVVQAAAGVGGGEATYVEDVFSTYLYTGTGSAQTITNGIDLDGEGGIVWIKDRGSASFSDNSISHDGAGFHQTHLLYAYGASSQYITSFNSDGFNVGTSRSESSHDYASWTFRKAPKFFDVVTWAGNNVGGRQIPHNLGSVPGMVIVKNTDASTSWRIWHRAVPGDTNDTSMLSFATSPAELNKTNIWAPNGMTDSYFTVSTTSPSNINETGYNYVAYVFAHDAGGFGDDGEQNVISCGSYTGTGVAGLAVTLGWEPQWILWKNASQLSDWNLFDNMRGMTVSGDQVRLRPNLSNAEGTYAQFPFPTATGFIVNEASAPVNGSGDTMIYIAIRRPMKTPESGTEVFAPEYGLNASAGGQAWSAGFPVDMYIRKNPTGGTNYIASRMTGNGPYMATDSTAAESSIPYSEKLDNMDGVFTTNAYDYTTWISWMFRRAPSVFDVVCYTGNSVIGREIPHNLGVAPELMIVKARNNTGTWPVYSGLNTSYLKLFDTHAIDTAGFWNNTSPTSSVFTVNSHSDVNLNPYTYVAYLFATLAGVSKVGSYTGTGADLNVDCGFSAGARFVLIKRTDTRITVAPTTGWYVWDSARGIVSGNDPYLLLNDTAAENTSTDYIDPLSSGFTVTSSAPAALNASGGSYIFLAIA
jgi:hypothetical protein